VGKRDGRPPLKDGRRSTRRSEESNSDDSDIALFMENEDIALKEVRSGKVDQDSSEQGGAGKVGVNSYFLFLAYFFTSQDIPHVTMIRERVNIYGNVRPMEPVEDMAILHTPPSQIGIIKEAPVRRWLSGQVMEAIHRYVSMLINVFRPIGIRNTSIPLNASRSNDERTRRRRQE
jgi:hypothetical protein